MSKPLRNRFFGAGPTSPCLEPVVLSLLRGCAQKESNLQPAYSDALSNSREIGSAPYSTGVTSATEPPTKPESGFPNRYGSVTAPFALSTRPDLLGYLEAVALESALAPTRTVKVWP